MSHRAPCLTLVICDIVYAHQDIGFYLCQTELSITPALLATLMPAPEWQPVFLSQFKSCSEGGTGHREGVWLASGHTGTEWCALLTLSAVSTACGLLLWARSLYCVRACEYPGAGARHMGVRVCFRVGCVCRKGTRTPLSSLAPCLTSGITWALGLKGWPGGGPRARQHLCPVNV